jgi:hypothetical protein
MTVNFPEALGAGDAGAAEQPLAGLHAVAEDPTRACWSSRRPS